MEIQPMIWHYFHFGEGTMWFTHSPLDSETVNRQGTIQVIIQHVKLLRPSAILDTSGSLHYINI